MAKVYRRILVSGESKIETIFQQAKAASEFAEACGKIVLIFLATVGAGFAIGDSQDFHAWTKRHGFKFDVDAGLIKVSEDSYDETATAAAQLIQVRDLLRSYP